jgi:hypothetical protein
MAEKKPFNRPCTQKVTDALCHACTDFPYCSILDELEKERARNAKLKVALKQAVDWFEEYAIEHRRKEKYDKAIDNHSKAFFLLENILVDE